MRDDGPGFRLGPEGLPVRGIGFATRGSACGNCTVQVPSLTLSNHPDGGAVVRLRLPIGDGAELAASVEGVSA